MGFSAIVLTGALLASGASFGDALPCSAPGLAIDEIRTQRLLGALDEAQRLATVALDCPGLEPEFGVALHLELARIHDRVGLHHNSRPVPTALEHIEQAVALETNPDLSTSAALELGQADYHYRAEMSAREFPTAIRHAEAAIRLFREAGDARGEADAVHRLGLIHFQRRELERARQLFDRSLELDDEAGSRAFFRGEYHRHIAFVYFVSDDVEAAIPHFQKSLRYRKDAVAIDASLFAAVSLGSALVDAGRAPEAVEPLLYALMIAEKIDSPAGKSRAGLVLGKMYEALGDPGSARQAYAMTLGLARSIGYQSIVRQAEEAQAELQ